MAFHPQDTEFSLFIFGKEDRIAIKIVLLNQLGQNFRHLMKDGMN